MSLVLWSLSHFSCSPFSRQYCQIIGPSLFVLSFFCFLSFSLSLSQAPSFIFSSPPPPLIPPAFSIISTSSSSSCIIFYFIVFYSSNFSHILLLLFFFFLLFRSSFSSSFSTKGGSRNFDWGGGKRCCGRTHAHGRGPGPPVKGPGSSQG